MDNDNSRTMEILEVVWDHVSTFFAGLMQGFERSITGLFGSSNVRHLKRLQPFVEKISALEDKYKAMSEEELRNQTTLFRERLAKGETLDDILVEAFAVCREGGRRFLNMRHYDVQLLGGMVLHEGNIAEMVTGEGKTLVATLPAYLNALEGKGVHVVTVNDYLARRDMEWMGPLYMGLGLTVGAIQSNMPTGERQKAYACDITYGTNNEFGFDYLRDNMRPAARGDDNYPKEMQQSQGPLHYAIVDEVDNILIDEARTPLIISGPAYDDVTKYPKADQLARQLKRDVHFEVKEKEHTVTLTDDGVREAEKLAGVESFYTAGNMEWPHLIDNALKAHHLYKRDVNYMIQDGSVIIVDEFTGRPMPGRQWSDGLHQAVEAKEGVRIKEENQTLATITLQNFFKLYKKISGMTGTAMTEANEFWKIYEMEVIAIPTNRELERVSYPDVVYPTEKAKYNAIVDEIERIHKWDLIELKGNKEMVGTITKETDDEVEIQPLESKKKETIPRSQIRAISKRGRPILVGTTSIENSERLHRMLDRLGIEHAVLNAKYHEKEAEIVAQAGRKGAVTIATNMAGRGTDIILGGNPETMAWSDLQDKYPTRLDVPKEEWEALIAEIEERERMKEEGREVASLGGLHVLGTERHEARRIDLQLVGRSGRQGDPGSSRFYLSLEDDLMRIFAGDWVKRFLERLGMQEDEAIESRMVSRRIEAAQKKVEERNFEIRKNLLEYDEVMDEQRKRVYTYRQQILQGTDCKQLIFDMIESQISESVDTYLDLSYGIQEFAAFASSQLGIPLEARDFRGMSYEDAERFAHQEAERLAETQVLEAVEENLPEDVEQREWNWEAITRWANRRWGLNLRDRDLKKLGGEEDELRDKITEFLLEKAREAVARVELSDGAKALDEGWGRYCVSAWMRERFDLEVDPQEIDEKDSEKLKLQLIEQAEAAYNDREAEFPVLAGLTQFSAVDSAGSQRLNREGLVAWARNRFEADLDVEDLKHKQREEIRDVLLEHSRRHRERTNELLEAVRAEKVPGIFKDADEEEDPTAFFALGGDTSPLNDLAEWLKQETGREIDPEELVDYTRDRLEYRLTVEVEEKFRPEMRRMERKVVLDLLDMAWKDHLLTMDYLRSSVAFRGYGQVDPKIEYKREGMKAFDSMWKSLGEQVTRLAFRMEQIDERVVRSIWRETEARHDEAVPATEMGQQQQEAIAASQQGESKPKPIRKQYDSVGRNEKCPCGSGKKYKKCCLPLIQKGQAPRWETRTPA